MKWRGTLGVLCDCKIPIMLKGKFFIRLLYDYRPAMLYVIKCFVVKKQHIHKSGNKNVEMDNQEYMEREDSKWGNPFKDRGTPIDEKIGRVVWNCLVMSKGEQVMNW